MLQKNKGRIALSSFIVLLPIAFGLCMWKSLPDTIATHWGVDGEADGFSSKAFAVFGLPGFLLLLHWICLLATHLDKRQERQSPKALAMVCWIIPIISIGVCGAVYCVALGLGSSVMPYVCVLLAALFLLIGNYLPKVRPNNTLGFRIPWTQRSEENWRRTHRFAGKVWVAGGAALLIAMLLPPAAICWAIFGVLAAMAILPIAYSYCLHRRRGEM
ncbi:MAG: SdpI family protein [Firmicutes bacterium]|nr:SdpI family protein [Bacillota bacterium]